MSIETKRLHPLKTDNTADITKDLVPDVIETNIWDANLAYKVPIQHELVAGTGIDIQNSNDHKQAISVNVTAMFNAIKQEIINAIYPVGSIYTSLDASKNPNTMFGGTWERLENTILWAMPQDSTRNIGDIKGDNILPLLEHNHTLTLKTHTQDESIVEGAGEFYTTESVFEDAAKYLMTGVLPTGITWADLQMDRNRPDFRPDKYFKQGKDENGIKTALPIKLSGQIAVGRDDYNTGGQPTVAEAVDNSELRPNNIVYGTYSNSPFVKNIVDTNLSGGSYTLSIESAHQHKIDYSKLYIQNAGTSTDTDIMNMIRNTAVYMWKRTA